MPNQHGHILEYFDGKTIWTGASVRTIQITVVIFWVGVVTTLYLLPEANAYRTTPPLGRYAIGCSDHTCTILDTSTGVIIKSCIMRKKGAEGKIAYCEHVTEKSY